jgi:hypothetical protein
MAKYKYNRLTDYSINNGVTENTTIFKYESPSFELTSGSYIIKDLNRMYNEAITCWLSSSDFTNSKFQILIGCDNAGNGVALRFDMSSSQFFIRLVYISSFGNPTYDSVIIERDLFNILNLVNNTFYKISLYLSQDKVGVLFDDVDVFEISNVTFTGNYFGFSGIDTPTSIFVSDIYYYSDSVFYGNVNLNGVPDDSGNVLMLNQQTYSMVNLDRCDVDGNWMIFLEDDPINFNKYVLIGYISDRPDLQPRGVGNITL